MALDWWSHSWWALVGAIGVGEGVFYTVRALVRLVVS